ncbi:MAG: C69 family dipeptidase [Tissierellia bacterium]|nr:C69 family dipeptidase [Tissierellia bacterium]
MKRYRKSLVMIIAVLMLISAFTSTYACTSMGVGKDASVDGSVMVTHTCDGWYDHRIQLVEGGKHANGEMVDIYRDPCTDTRPNRVPEKVGEIPQVEETYTYFHIGYPFMNEKQVVMGEFTWSGREEVSCPQGLFVIANLEQLGLQRAATAREAIEVMGALAEEYGYYDGGETLIVGDENEVWVFEVCGGGMLWEPGNGTPGAHWAAQRIPDDEAFVGANRSRIGVIDFNDKENFMYSTDITKLPKELGWWSEGEDFHYAKIFNPEPYGSPFYASRREWRVFSLLAPSKEFPVLDRYEHYPFSIKPDQKLKVQDLMDIYSDHYEGTPYDLTKGLAAGPFGSPTRWGVKGDQKPGAAAENRHDWERSIALYRCSYSFVSQSRSWLPDPVGGVLWFGQDSPDTTVYVPMYSGVTEVPESWSSGLRHKFDPNSAWWAFNFVNNWANLRWDAMYEEIREKKASYEDVFFAEQSKVDAEAADLYNKNPSESISYLNKYTNDAMTTVEEGWWEFAWHLVGKYHDGQSINEDGSSTTLGYPTDYLEAVDYAGTSVRDFAMTQGVEEVEEPEEPEVQAPVEEEKTPTTPSEPEQGNNNAFTIVILIIIAAVAAWFVISKKRK